MNLSKLFATLVLVCIFIGAPFAVAANPTAVPFVFDPGKTDLVSGHWASGTRCPTSATAFIDDPSTPLVFDPIPTPYADTACPTGDAQDKQNEGLVLVKTGPTPNFASSGVVIDGVSGTSPLTELGYDIRNVNGVPTHCGAGAPRFNVVTADGVTHFVGCASPPPSSSSSSTGWTRRRWDATALAAAFPPILATDTVSSIAIVFDEAQDAGGGPDSSGVAILDNIDINGTLIGKGPTGK